MGNTAKRPHKTEKKKKKRLTKDMSKLLPDTTETVICQVKNKEYLS